MNLRTFRHLIQLAIALTALTMSATAKAEFVCSGVVSSVMWNPVGMLIVNYGAGYHVMCYATGNVTVNMGSSWGTQTITPAMCNNMYAMFLTSKSTRQKLYFYYTPGTATSCAQLGNWDYTNPYPYQIDMSETQRP